MCVCTVGYTLKSAAPLSFYGLLTELHSPPRDELHDTPLSHITVSTTPRTLLPGHSRVRTPYSHCHTAATPLLSLACFIAAVAATTVQPFLHPRQEPLQQDVCLLRLLQQLHDSVVLIT